MVFTHLSSIVDPSSTSKMDVEIVTNIGSLRSGVLKGEFVDENNVKIVNLITLLLRALIFCSYRVIIGFNFFSIVLIEIEYDIIVSRSPKF